MDASLRPPMQSGQLHARLVAQQNPDELRRKMFKAMRRGLWTQEDLDYAEAAGVQLGALFKATYARGMDAEGDNRAVFGYCEECGCALRDGWVVINGRVEDVTFCPSCEGGMNAEGGE